MTSPLTSPGDRTSTKAVPVGAQASLRRDERERSVLHRARGRVGAFHCDQWKARRLCSKSFASSSVGVGGDHQASVDGPRGPTSLVDWSSARRVRDEPSPLPTRRRTTCFRDRRRRRGCRTRRRPAEEGFRGRRASEVAPEPVGRVGSPVESDWAGEVSPVFCWDDHLNVDPLNIRIVAKGDDRRIGDERGGVFLVHGRCATVPPARQLTRLGCGRRRGRRRRCATRWAPSCSRGACPAASSSVPVLAAVAGRRGERARWSRGLSLVLTMPEWSGRPSAQARGSPRGRCRRSRNRSACRGRDATNGVRANATAARLNPTVVAESGLERGRAEAEIGERATTVACVGGLIRSLRALIPSLSANERDHSESSTTPVATRPRLAGWARIGGSPRSDPSSPPGDMAWKPVSPASPMAS